MTGRHPRSAWQEERRDDRLDIEDVLVVVEAPEWKDQQPFKVVLEGDMRGAAARHSSFIIPMRSVNTPMIAIRRSVASTRR